MFRYRTLHGIFEVENVHRESCMSAVFFLEGRRMDAHVELDPLHTFAIWCVKSSTGTLHIVWAVNVDLML